jgi:hypothetical protein
MKKKKMSETITQKEFYDSLDVEVKRIVKWINKTESPTDACETFIYQLVTELGESHFTTVGILMETLLAWRTASIKVCEEEDTNK